MLLNGPLRHLTLKDSGADTPAKVAVHALIGGLMTKAMGGDFGTGAVGAAAAKLAVELFAQDITDIQGLSQQDKDALTQLLGLVVAKAATQLAGGTETDGNASGINAKPATEFNYLKHQERKDLSCPVELTTTAPICGACLIVSRKTLSRVACGPAVSMAVARTPVPCKASTPASGSIARCGCWPMACVR